METIYTLLDSLDTPTFYGVNNSNILCLKNQHPDGRVVARGYQVKVTGAEKAIERFDSNHVLSVDKTGTMSIDAGTGNISLSGEHYSFGNNNEKKIHVYSGESSALYHNAKRTSTSEIRDYDGSSSAIEFSNNGIRFRTAEKQDTRGNEISNWKDMLLLNTDGKIGVGSMTTYLENDGNSLLLHSPYNMNIESGHVTLTGKVGVNTVNMQGDGFAGFVSDGDEVKAGQKLLSFDIAKIRAAGFSPITAVLLTNSEDIEGYEVGVK